MYTSSNISRTASRLFCRSGGRTLITGFPGNVQKFESLASRLRCHDTGPKTSLENRRLVKRSFCNDFKDTLSGNRTISRILKPDLEKFPTKQAKNILKCIHHDIPPTYHFEMVFDGYKISYFLISNFCLISCITIGLEIGHLSKITFWSLLKVPFRTDLLMKTVWKNSVAKLV